LPRPLTILAHSGYDTETVRTGLGAPQYSYHFVLMGFLPALEQLGTVVRVRTPEEVDPLYDACLAKGEDCVFLCFAPPHLVPLTLRCPTIPVVAWEFSNIPCVMWSEDPRSDWRLVFRHCGRAITLCQYTANVVREAMGSDYPVFVVPTASYDAFAPLFQPKRDETAPRRVKFRGVLFDSDTEPRLRAPLSWPPVPPPPPEPPLPPPPLRGMRARLSRSLYHGEAWYRDVVRDALPGWGKTGLSQLIGAGRRVYRTVLPRPAPMPPPPPPPEPEHELDLTGIVYTSVFAPQDGRKNWHDLLTGLLWAFRDEPRATIVLKMPRNAWSTMHPHLDHALTRFAPFSCRLVLIYGFLEDEDYAGLVRASDFYVNASHCEGLCIPLMEFFAAGKPAIAPDHTAFADYVTPRIAFVPRSTLEHNVWPFDPRDIFTTMRYRLDWGSFETGLRESFDMAVAEDGEYAAMARAAHDEMRDYCSVNTVRALLAQALSVEQQIPEYEAAE